MAKKKKQRGPGAGGAGAVAPEQNGGGLSQQLLSCAVKSAQWLAAAPGKGDAAVTERLLSAVKPIIFLRAAKYELDAQASKGGEANAPGKALPSRKRRLEETSSPKAPSGEDVEQAVEAFKALAAQPEQLLAPSCKLLRSALHPLVEAHKREEKASPAFRITCMLGQKPRWPEAQRVLGELRSLEAAKRPKLGAYQRWVRELDVAEGDPTELLMLDAVMRVAAGLGPANSRPSEGRLCLVPPWRPDLPEAPEDPPSPKPQPAESTATSVANKLLNLISLRKVKGDADGKAASTSFRPGDWRILAHEAAADRLPPNRYDLDIFICPPSALQLSGRPPRPTQRHELPGVPGAFVLSDVLAPQECHMLRQATEAMGYRPDVPLSSALDERAHNVVLMANDAQNAALFKRVQHLLPSELGGEKLLGINRRWRFYRYLSGNLYRKHLDGAWPASGLRRGEDGQDEYVYDAYGGGTRSKLTFIIYLNDDFEGGCTTFYTPNPGTEGTLDSRPVKPRIGSASVFPHGDCGIPLLHEGSAVISGTKYLLRTDVVYARPETSEELKRAARLRGLARQLGGLGGQGLLQEKEAPEAPPPSKPRKAKASKKRSKKQPAGKHAEESVGAAKSGGATPASAHPKGVKKKIGKQRSVQARAHGKRTKNKMSGSGRRR